MQRIIAILFFALFVTTTTAAAGSNAVPNNQLKKTFDLNLQDDDNYKMPSNTSSDDQKLRFDYDAPSQGEKKLVDQMKIKPEFRYVQDDADSTHDDTHYKEFKLKMNLDF